MIRSGLAIALALLLTGCMTAQQHTAAVSDPGADRLTVGTVQARIHKGMSGGEVAQVLGSPNIVSTDENGNEVWVYDKISTLDVVSSSASGLTLGLGGVGAGIGGIGAGGFSSRAGARSTSQRTLTVIIKYNADKRVRDYAYHYSSF